MTVERGIHTKPRLFVKEVAHCFQHQLFAGAGERVRLFIATAIRVDSIATDVPHTAVSIARNADELVGSHCLSLQLKLHERFTWKMQHPD